MDEPINLVLFSARTTGCKLQPCSPPAPRRSASP